MNLVRSIWLVLVLTLPFSVNAQRYVRSFPTIDAMLAANAVDVSTNAIVLGRNAANDGGGGSFLRFDLIRSDKSGHSLQSPTSNGRWVRVVTDATVDVRMFGAKVMVLPTTRRPSKRLSIGLILSQAGLVQSAFHLADMLWTRSDFRQVDKKYSEWAIGTRFRCRNEITCGDLPQGRRYRRSVQFNKPGIGTLGAFLPG